jgi:phosphoribosylcarboxyaminoimidazole (NCAIR) mutase
MKSYLAVGFTASALASSAVALAGVVAAAPTGPSQVDETVRTLEASGYNVIVNRTGAAPLSECTVSAVRPGVTHQTTDVRGSDIKPMIISDTVYVDVAC